MFIVVGVLFYSSFFTNYPKGVRDALQTLKLWRGRTHEHEHPWSQYIYWLLQEEGVVMILGGIGALIAVWRANNRLALFLAQWSFGLLAAYSLFGYNQQIVPTTEPIIIGSKAQEEQLKANYGDRYQQLSSGEDEGAFALRPGVDLLLYVRRDVAR